LASILDAILAELSLTLLSETVRHLLLPCLN